MHMVYRLARPRDSHPDMNGLCGLRCAQSTTAGSARASSTLPAAATTRSTAHVMVVMMENKSYSEVIGQSSQPYTNSLANDYGLATQSYAFGHPSLPNYLDLVSGSNQEVTDDGDPAAHVFPGVPTLADQLASAGVTERAYAENLPAVPSTDSGEYAVRHFPWEYFPGTKMPMSDASSLVGDLNSSDPPDFVRYTPNLIDDEHDGTVEQEMRSSRASSRWCRGRPGRHPRVDREPLRREPPRGGRRPRQWEHRLAPRSKLSQRPVWAARHRRTPELQPPTSRQKDLSAGHRSDYAEGLITLEYSLGKLCVW